MRNNYLRTSIITTILLSTYCFGVKEKPKEKESIQQIQNRVCSMKIKKDQYRRARGGTSTIYEIHCAACSNPVMYYQKDGPGQLLRCYLNRIMYPKKLEDLHHDPRIKSKKDMPNLNCTTCAQLIGKPMVYKLDNRLAFRMIRGSFFYKKLKTD